MVEENTQQSLQIKCSCGSEILELTYDTELKTYDIAIFSLDVRKSWRAKLRAIWRIIRTGDPFSDQMVVRESEVKKLSEFIDSQVNNK